MITISGLTKILGKIYYNELFILINLFIHRAAFKGGGQWGQSPRAKKF